jgi:DNA polymerase-3 subunit delta
MSLPQLRKSLVEHGPKPITLIVGDARPLIEQAVAAVTEASLPSVGVPAFNVTTCRCGEDDPDRALDSARTLPMMAARRLVVIRDVQEASDGFWTALVQYLQSPPDTTVLVLTTQTMKAREKARKALLKQVDQQAASLGAVCTLQTSSIRPRQFAVDVAERLGKTLGRREADLLVEVVGDDLSRLEREVEKIVVFIGEADVITAEAIEEVGTALAEAVLWDLTTGVASGDRDLALTALHRLVRSGNDPRRLLAMLLWQTRELLLARELLLQGVEPRDIGRRTKVKPHVLKRAHRRLMSDAFEAGAVLTRLRQAHFEMNGHRSGAERVLESLVFDLLARGT